MLKSLQACNAKAKALWEAELKAFTDNLAAQNAAALQRTKAPEAAALRYGLPSL